MKRTARVARTAYDLTHVNRLHVPQFGVVKLYIAAGAKISKSYLLDTAPAPKAEAAATDDMHFAPEKETVKIKYEIDDWCGVITKATLELFYRDNATAVWSKALTADECAHGEHELDWTGKIPKSAEFPEEFITVQHSPYKLKLTLEGEGYGYSAAAWTYFHVLVHSIELELGAKDTLSAARDQALWDKIKGAGSEKAAIPAGGAVKKIELLSNIFSTGDDKADNTLYTQYETLWGDGPNIPIFAKLYVLSSTDAKEDVPKAIGKVRLLWSWEDVKEDLSIHFTEAKEYLTDTLDYCTQSSEPKGDNCHKDHGGKRGDDAKLVFPAQAGYAPAATLTAGSFPFKVEQCATRKWSSYCETWPTGKLMGMGGVVFQPSRMAGDAYTIQAYFPHDRKIDGKDDLDAKDDKGLAHAVSASTGTFQIWREMHIVKYVQKVGTITAIALGTVADYYSKAYIDLVDKSGGPSSPMADYDTKLRNAVSTESAARKAAVMAGDQGAITESGIKYRSYAGFKTEFQTQSGKTDPEMASWLTSNNLDTVDKYETFLEAIADTVVIKACNDYFSASEGINVFQFNLYWEADGGLESGTNGFASTSFGNCTRNKAGYLQSRVNYGVGSKNNMQQTTTHEIGHICFLPHAPTAGGYVESLHDDKSHWNNCTMSYNYDRERMFCGLCLLRMRGWNQTGLNSDSATNKKT
jgi:hypothetical protein